MVKKVWNYTSTLPYIFMAWYLIKHWDNFTFIDISEPSACFFRVKWLKKEVAGPSKILVIILFLNIVLYPEDNLK